MAEYLVNLFFTFFLTWWIVLFMVLPFGVQRDENPEKGNSSAAPKNVNFKKKFFITTIISLFVSLTILEIMGIIL